MNGEKNRYVSILKQKAGELAAVKELVPEIWDMWNPLFELRGDETTDAAALRQEVIAEISNACVREGAVVFLYFDYLDFLAANNMLEILIRLEQAKLVPIPVVTLPSNANTRTAARDFIATRGRRLAVRVFFNEVDAN